MLRRIAMAILSCGVLLASSARGQDDMKLSCIEKNANAQKAEQQAKFRTAHALLVACASSSCPAEVKSDCSTMLSRVEAKQPTVVLQVRDESGRATTDVKVYVDDELLAEHLTGQALPVDPGEHRLRVDLHGNKQDLKVFVVEGEKERTLSFDYMVKNLEPQRPKTAPPKRATVPWLTWVLGGATIASAGGFAYFGVTGNSIKNRLDGSCRPTKTCSSSDYSDMATSYYAADIFGGVAAASLIGTLVTLIAWPRSRPPVDVEVNGLGATVRGRF